MIRSASLLIFAAGGLAFAGNPVRADEAVVPDNGFTASRYEVLWTKSPFSVASADETATSPDYSLTGLSRLDGISYASLLDKKSQEHFLLSSDKPVRGLTLVSISSQHDEAVIQRSGESITLKLEQPIAVAAAAPGQNPPPANVPQSLPTRVGNSVPVSGRPGGPASHLPMSGAVYPGGSNIPGANRTPPAAMFRPRMIHVPPPPQQNPQNQSH